MSNEDCFMCNKEHMKPYTDSMEFMDKHNQWDNLDAVNEVLKDKSWSWARNHECKYLDVRIDMRDGGCLIEAKGKRISPRQLKWQCSEETPNPIPDHLAYKEEDEEPDC